MKSTRGTQAYGLAWGVLLAASALLGCGEDSDSAPLGGSEHQGLFADCASGEPCLVITFATADDESFVRLEDGDTLGVFDGLQGLVAAWVTVLIADSPTEPPLVTTRLTVDGEVVNTPNALLVPFLDGGGGVYYRPQYMIPFNEPCCALDYDGLEGELEIEVVFPDLAPLTRTFQVNLEHTPNPLL